MALVLVINNLGILKMISPAKRAVSIINSVEKQETSVLSGFDEIAQILLHELKSEGIIKNLHNSVQIARIMAAELFPNDPLYKPTAENISSGNTIVFTDDSSESYDVYRGCAIFLLSIVDSEERGLPERGANILLDFYNDSEYAPDDVIEYSQY